GDHHGEAVEVGDAGEDELRVALRVAVADRRERLVDEVVVARAILRRCEPFGAHAAHVEEARQAADRVAFDLDVVGVVEILEPDARAVDGVVERGLDLAGELVTPGPHVAEKRSEQRRPQPATRRRSAPPKPPGTNSTSTMNSTPSRNSGSESGT